MKYYSVDEGGNWKPFIAILICNFVPIFGPIWFGTKVTSRYRDVRVMGGIIAVLVMACHIGGIIYLILKL